MEATRISLSVQSVRLKHERREIRNETSEIQISILFSEDGMSKIYGGISSRGCLELSPLSF